MKPHSTLNVSYRERILNNIPEKWSFILPMQKFNLQNLDRVNGTLVLIVLAVLSFLASGLVKIFEVNQIFDLMDLFVEIFYFLVIIICFGFNREHLSEFKINQITLILFFLFGVIARSLLSKLSNDSLGSITPSLFFTIAIPLFFIMKKDMMLIREVNWRDYLWLLVGIITGFLLISLIIFPNLSNFYPLFDIIVQRGYEFLLFMVIFGFVSSLAFETIQEEILFRGFLWGVLEQKGWKLAPILLTQVVLFNLTNIHIFFSSSFRLWMILTLSRLIFSLLVWRSKSVSVSIMANTVLQTVLYIITFLVIG